MKRISAIVPAILLALFLLTACGGNNDGNENGGGNGTPAGNDNNPPAAQGGETVGRMNPPAWLIGEWGTTEGGNPQSETIVVTEHNVVVSSGKLDFSWQINNTGLIIREITDENYYRLEYTIQDLDFSYAFTLQEDGSMKLRLFDAGISITYTKK